MAQSQYASRRARGTVTCHAIFAVLAGGCLGMAAPAWGQTHHEDRKIVPADGEPDEYFGYALGIDNGIMAIAAPQDDDRGQYAGAVYLYEAATGEFRAKLFSLDGIKEDGFGQSVSIEGGIVAIGAWLDDDNGIDSGSAYLFSAATGEQLFKLVPDDGAAGDWFGWSIALDEGIVAVGACLDQDNGEFSGSVYLFDATTGNQIAKLLPDDGAMGDWFGWSVAIDSGVVAVGAWQDDDKGFASGSVYLFDADTGTQRAKLVPNDGAESDLFGWSVAIDSGVVAIGTNGDDDNGYFSGSVYLFDAATGTQTTKILPTDGSPDSFFGQTVSLDSGLLAVGARGEATNGSMAGAGYVFEVDTGIQIAKLLPTDGAEDEQFGYAIGIEHNTIAVGARWDNDNGPRSGSAFVFTTSEACPADLNGDGEVNTQDFTAFLNAWASSDPLADWDDDGTINTQDFIAYLGDWAAGC